jgi:NADH-quinone oxidoreductase subunit G
VEAGCLPGLLPGGRPVSDSAARVDVSAHWGAESLPAAEGLDAPAMLAAAASGQLEALVIGGVELADFADAAAARDAVEKAGFVVSLESRLSEVTERADVVFPVALIEERSGTFLNWEHRPGRVNTVVKQPKTPMTDLRVLAALADALGRPLGVRMTSQALAELTELGAWDRPVSVKAAARTRRVAKAQLPKGERVRLATWHELLDAGRGQDNETALAATAHKPVARVGAALAARLGAGEGDTLTVAGPTGSHTLPLVVAPDMVDGTVWIPTKAPGMPLGEIAAVHGDEVSVRLGGGE